MPKKTLQLWKKKFEIRTLKKYTNRFEWHECREKDYKISYRIFNLDNTIILQSSKRHQIKQCSLH